MAPTLFHPNFRGVPVAPDRPCWGQPEHEPMGLKSAKHFRVIGNSRVSISKAYYGAQVWTKLTFAKTQTREVCLSECSVVCTPGGQVGHHISWHTTTTTTTKTEDQPRGGGCSSSTALPSALPLSPLIIVPVSWMWCSVQPLTCLYPVLNYSPASNREPPCCWWG